MFSEGFTKYLNGIVGTWRLSSKIWCFVDVLCCRSISFQARFTIMTIAYEINTFCTYWSVQEKIASIQSLNIIKVLIGEEGQFSKHVNCINDKCWRLFIVWQKLSHFSLSFFQDDFWKCWFDTSSLWAIGVEQFRRIFCSLVHSNYFVNIHSATRCNDPWQSVQEFWAVLPSLLNFSEIVIQRFLI